MFKGTLCDVPGIRVGHATDPQAMTGCTVILPGRDGAAAGVDVRGAAPGTRETDLLRPGNLIEHIHAVVLSGGSAFGLEASSGVMEGLEAHGIGFDSGYARVPIVCSAVLYDLGIGRADVRPDKAMGRAAYEAAGTDCPQGSIGAGTGATVGKIVPGATPAKGGIGTASMTLPDGVIIGALVAVNAAGDVYDPHLGELLACGRLEDRPVQADRYLLRQGNHTIRPGGNTTIGVIATTAKLDKAQANRLATTAHDGLARTIRPVHTVMDGDTLFTLSMGDAQASDMVTLGAAAAEVTARAVANAVMASRGGGNPWSWASA